MPFDTAHADDAKHANRTKLIIKVFFLFLIILRFLLGSLGAWLLIALMVVTGIWFPAQQAIDIQPAEALHEE